MSSKRATPEQVSEALALIDGGMSVRAAAAATGWAHGSVRNWLRRRTDSPPPPPADASPVAAAVHTARADFLSDPHLGRFPAILEPGKLETVLRCISKGMSLETSAARAGVTRQTVHGWMRHIEAGTEPYAQFGALVAEAHASGIEELHDSIRSGRPGWQGAAWMLERRARAEYGRSVQVEHSVGGPLEQMGDRALVDVLMPWVRDCVDVDEDDPDG